MRLGTIVGLVLTALWVIIVALWSFILGYTSYIDAMLPNEIGDFLAGIVAPIAFLWIIVGYFQQGEELRQNNEILKQQAIELQESVRQMKLQSAVISDNELHARRATFFTFYEILKDRLNSISVDILLRCVSHDVRRRVRPSEKADKVESERKKEILDRYGSGNSEFIYSEIIYFLIQGRNAEFVTVMERYMDWPEIIRSYCVTFEEILSEARKCGDENRLASHFEYTTAGSLYMLFCNLLSYKPKFETRAGDKKEIGILQ